MCFFHTTWNSHNDTYIPPLCSPIPSQSARLGSLCFRELTSHPPYTWWCTHVDAAFSIHPTLSLPRCPLVSSLHLCLHSFPANMFINTILPHSTCVHATFLQSCLTLCSLLGSSVPGILQARILQWEAMPSFRGSSRPGDRSCISCVSYPGRWVLYHWCPLGSPMAGFHMYVLIYYINFSLTDWLHSI